jgi:hypothetical protein
LVVYQGTPSGVPKAAAYETRPLGPDFRPTAAKADGRDD